MIASASNLLDRCLHRDDASVASRLAIATRTVAGGWQRLTYADLERRSAALASRLAALGVRPGDRVALVCDAGGDWAAAFLGILRRGAVVVPFDLKLTVAELAPLTRRSRLAAAVVSPPHVARWTEAVERAGCPVPVLGPMVHDGHPEDEPARASASPAPAGDAPRSAADTALLVWTSGTTGPPKGVQLSLANLAYVVSQASAVQAVEPDARWLSVLPPNHLLELCCGLLPALAAGSSTFVARTVVPGELAGLMAECRADQMVVVPMVLRLIKRHVEAAAHRTGAGGLYLRCALRLAATIPSAAVRRAVLVPVHRWLGGRLRAFYCGGAPLDPEVEAFFDRLGIGVYEGYGLTEAAPTVAMNSPGNSRAGSVGRPLPGTEVRIGTDAEILVRSPGVMLGYWEDEASTIEAIDPAGWLHTGDRGHLDADGFLFVTGRAKSQIALESGKKVQPEEVEQALARGDLFSDVCVVGWRGAGGQPGERVCAVVVPSPVLLAGRPDRAAVEETAADEVRRLTAGLSGFKRPTVVRLLEGELPKTPKRSVRRAEVVRLLKEQEVRP